MKALRRLASVAASLLAFTSSLGAEPLFPNVRAAASANGKFLVAVEVQYLNPDQEVRTITGVRYHVLKKEEFINDKFNTENPFWSEEWEVALPKGQGIPALPFISNDGKYLVLASVDAPFSDAVVLRVYREHRFGGEDLVGTYKLRDIWTADELKAHAVLVSGARPLWFEGSTLGFFADGNAFVVKTAWGREIRLDLTNGATN